MKTNRVALWVIATGAILAFVPPSRGQFVDTFSTTTAADAVNYTQVESFGGNSPSVFAINSSQQFQPTNTNIGKTTQYYRNDSTLSDTVFGNTVSVEIDNVASGSAAAGLAFATSTGGANFMEFSLLLSGSNGSITNRTGSFNVNFALGPIIETVTRVDDTDFNYTFSGLGLTGGPITGQFTDTNFAGKNVVFGLDVYSGGSSGAGQEIEDNLQFALSAPEPSIWAMLLGGVAALLGVARLRAFRA